jgi:hypothetical protein
MSPTHCTQPGVFVVPQSTGPAPPSVALDASVGVVVEPSADMPPELLDVPLEEPLSDEPLEEPLDDPEPPSEPLFVLSSPPQPIPTATAAARATPRYFFSDDMAGLVFVIGFPDGSRSEQIVCRDPIEEASRSLGQTKRHPATRT